VLEARRLQALRRQRICSRSRCRHDTLDRYPEARIVSQAMKNRKRIVLPLLSAVCLTECEPRVTIERVMRTTAPAPQIFAFAKPASAFASSTSAPSHTPKTMARPNASSNQLARMGLCPGLQHLKKTRRRVAKMLHRYNWHRPHGISVNATDQQTRPGREQPLRLHS